MMNGMNNMGQMGQMGFGMLVGGILCLGLIVGMTFVCVRWWQKRNGN
jgi:hypothetical protein